MRFRDSTHENHSLQWVSFYDCGCPSMVMCIFSRPVKLVGNTRMFAKSCTAGRQVLVYGMTMDPDADLAMILPLPIELGIDELDVNFIDMSSYVDFRSRCSSRRSMGTMVTACRRGPDSTTAFFSSPRDRPR